MGADRGTPDDPGDEPSVPLSTGQTVDLPLETQATVLGAAFSAPTDGVGALLPDELRPLRATPTGNAAVVLLSVEYHHVGVPGIEPYDEFAVVVPAVPDVSDVAVESSDDAPVGGYVWYLPVTSNPARALGVDVWGYPKTVADVAHEDVGSRRRTTVTVDGERFVELSVDRPPSVGLSVEASSYAGDGGDLQRIPAAVDGDLGGWPLSSAVSLTFGDHDRAGPLRDLDLGGRALARVSFEGRVTFHEGVPVGQY